MRDFTKRIALAVLTMASSAASTLAQYPCTREPGWTFASTYSEVIPGTNPRQLRMYVSNVAYSNYRESRKSIGSRAYDAAKIRRDGLAIGFNEHLCYATETAARDARGEFLAGRAQPSLQVIYVAVASDAAGSSQSSSNSGNSSSSSTSQRSYPSALGSPSSLARCAAAYSVVFSADGRSSQSQGRAITAAVDRAGRETVRPMFRSLKDQYDAGAVSLSTARAFTRDCDRIHGLSFNQ
jgi:hypothetical protein